MGKYLGRLIPKGTEVIVTIEADGIGIAHFVGAEVEIPVVISKHFHYNVPCIELEQQAGYHKRTMYLPKAVAGKKIAIVDCMVSTGGTVKSLVKAIESLENTQITGIFVLNDKNNYRSTEKTLEGYPYKYLIDAQVNEQGIVEADWSFDLRTVFWEMMDEQFFALSEYASQFSNVSKRGYQVGSIIVDAENFEILSWGFRRGNMHAEQDAISMLKTNCPDWESRKLTIYSTMEPCIYRNDKGQRSCAEHIADLGNIKWVIIGETDKTDDKINGGGITHLANSGKYIRLIETNEIFKPEEIIIEV
jgi:adenine/guanine phosphoribosyltransferase-like PRPP-binding protein/pyrimidine deaminase RibD-like protein